MTALLLKIFIGKGNYEEFSTRVKVGKFAATTGMVLNVLLAAVKLTIGAVFGLISIIADGFNNLTDCGNNVVSLVGFSVSAKPADREHPYGHARAEYVAALIVAVIILVVAVELAVESVGKILAPSSSDLPLWTLIVMVVTVLVKLWMFFFNKKLSKTIHSAALNAAAVDSLTDSVATFAVLVCLLIAKYAHLAIDGYVGCAVALFIAFAGICVLKDTASKLIGRAPDKDFCEEITRRISAFGQVLGVHDLAVHSYGEARCYASVHVEVDSSLPLSEAHEVADRIERDFAENTAVSLIVHLDPVDVRDAETSECRRRVEEFLATLGKFTVHDFHLTHGEKTDVNFEVTISYESTLSPDKLEELLRNFVSGWEGNYQAVVKVEKA